MMFWCIPRMGRVRFATHPQAKHVSPPLGGALGNLIDRLRQGHVTDFVDTGPWFIWNLADLAITSGVILFGFAYWREIRREEAAKRLAEQATAPYADVTDSSPQP